MRNLFERQIFLMNESLGIEARHRRRFLIQEQVDPNELVSVGTKDRKEDNDYGNIILMRADAAWAFQRLREAAAIEGINIRSLSGYRSAERQAEIVRNKIKRGVSVDEILKVNTPPGYSEHNTGRTIDVGGDEQAHDLESSFKDTKEYRWLKKNAEKFGFCFTYEAGNPWGIIPEPWHITYGPSKDPNPPILDDDSWRGGVYLQTLDLSQRRLTENEIKRRIDERLGTSDTTPIPLFSSLSALPPENSLVVSDSRMTLKEAFAGMRKDWPKGIAANQELITVYYYGFDMKLHQGQLVLDYRLIPDILGFFEYARYLKYPMHPAVPISCVNWDDQEAMRRRITHCFNPRTIEGSDTVSPHGFGQAIDFGQSPNTVFYYEDSEGSRLKHHTKGFRLVSLPENAEQREAHLGTLYFPTRCSTGEAAIVHPLLEYFKSRDWLCGAFFNDFTDSHHVQKRLDGTPTLQELLNANAEEVDL